MPFTEEEAAGEGEPVDSVLAVPRDISKRPLFSGRTDYN